MARLVPPLPLYWQGERNGGRLGAGFPDWKGLTMLDLNQSVIVIGEKGVTYEGYIMQRAAGENGSAAYRIGLEGAGFEQVGQWHRSSDVYVAEPLKEDAE